ncbi:MAG: hypothetical protein ABSA32_09235 [Candidatus Acidiferrales bacterium]|jgi:hypothetical protein
MISRTSALLAVIAIFGMSLVQADDGWVIREDGVGPIKVGMTLPQLNATLHERFSMPRNKDDQACFYVKSTQHAHIAFMIDDGHFSRVDVDAPGIPTTEGIQVGDSEEHARRVYGAQMKVEPQKYIDDGHYLTVRSADGRYGIRFETEKGKIQDFYAGQFDDVQLVEGCL